MQPPSTARMPARPAPTGKLAWGTAVILLLLWSFSLAWEGLGGLFTADGLRQMGAYASRLWPPATDGEFLRLVAWAALETLAISIAGSVLSVLIAGALLYFATSEKILGGGGEVENTGIQRSAARNTLLVASRTALNLFRTIPELVWGIIWVFVVGLGPFAGVLALGIHNGGVLGKLYSESMENVRPGPVEAIRASGGRRTSAFLYAALPQTWSQIVAYTLYRWEVSIRAAAILGFVGAGGLGQQMHISISLFLENRLVTLIAAIFILVSAVDLFSGWLRRKLDAGF